MENLQILCKDHNLEKSDKLIDFNETDNVQIGIDDTDHISFFCNECNKVMKVFDCYNRNYFKKIESKSEKDKVTYIKLFCLNCKKVGYRKFYWTLEDGKFCWQKTKKEEKE